MSSHARSEDEANTVPVTPRAGTSRKDK